MISKSVFQQNFLRMLNVIARTSKHFARMFPNRIILTAQRKIIFWSVFSEIFKYYNKFVLSVKTLYKSGKKFRIN